MKYIGFALLVLLAATSSNTGAADTQPAQPQTGFVVNVRDFGAVGDGVKDDAPAIQSAMNALQKAGHGKIVFEPFAVYRLSRWVGLHNVNDFEIDGQGATLKPTDRATVFGTEGDTLRLVACNRVRVHDLTFDGNRTRRGHPLRSTTPETFRINGCTDFVVRDCHFRDSVCDDVFLWCNLDPTNINDRCQYGRITGCTFENPWRNCVSVIHGCFIRIDHNVFRDAQTSSPFAGIDIEPNRGDAPGITHDIDIESNTFVNCGAGAAAYYGKSGTHHVTFTSNRVSKCKIGLYSEAVDSAFIGNTLDEAPLIAANCDRNRMLNNVVTRSYLYVDTLGVDNPAGHVVIDNVADEIHVEGAKGHTISEGNVKK
jgi:hypothetical protein